MCVGCGKNEETDEEFVSCPGLTDGKSTAQDEKVQYSRLFGQSVSDMEKVAKEMRKRIKVREKILDGPT